MIYRRRRIPYLLFISRLARRIKKRYCKSTKNDITRPKETSVQTQTNQKSQKLQFSAVYQFRYSQSKGQNNKQLFEKLAQLIPVKLLDCPLPTYRYPDKVKVVISKPEFSEKRQNILIPYEQNDINTLYKQISLKQFLQYKGELHLSIAQMSLQKHTVNLPEFITEFFTQKIRGITKNNIKMINLWHYKGNRISSWHYDGHDNFLFMIQGKKIIYLMQPNNNITGKQYFQSPQYHKTKGVFDQNHNHSKTDNFFQFTLRKKYYRCQVNKDECLFIPRGWWHYVQSIGQSNIAINIWGNSIQNIIQKTDQEMMLKHLIFQVSDKLIQKDNNQKGPNQNSQKLKQKYRKSCFHKYLQRIID